MRYKVNRKFENFYINCMEAEESSYPILLIFDTTYYHQRKTLPEFR